MRAMILRAPRSPLALGRYPYRGPAPGQVLLRVHACGVCRTDLHVVDGELPDPRPPVVPGHEIVGRGRARRGGRAMLAVGERVGVPWLGWTCGDCRSAARGPREPLRPRRASPATTIDGGYAEYAVADERYCFPLPDGYRRRGGGAAAVRRA